MIKFVSAPVNEKEAFAKRGYKLVKKLNSGSFANVYLAEFNPTDNQLEEPIILACKVFNAAKLIKSKVLSRKFIHRELVILSKLNHPYVINVHKILQWFDRYYIFMPYAENGDLLIYIQELTETIPENQCRIWFRQLSLGVQYIHEMEIAHRDIKCENILITSDMKIKLADFGFSRYVIDEDGKRILSNTFCGSVNYIAPEIVNTIPYDPMISDLWSMGVILFIMLNKSVPFKATDPARMYHQQTERHYKFRNKNISEQARTLVNHLLEPVVDERWTVKQVLECEWFAMDQSLAELTLEEQEGLNNAKMERQKHEERLREKPKQA